MGRKAELKKGAGPAERAAGLRVGEAGGERRTGLAEGEGGKPKWSRAWEGAQDYALFFSPLLSIPAGTGKTSYVTDFLYKPVREVSMQQNTSGPYE